MTTATLRRRIRAKISDQWMRRGPIALLDESRQNFGVMLQLQMVSQMPDKKLRAVCKRLKIDR